MDYNNNSDDNQIEILKMYVYQTNGQLSLRMTDIRTVILTFMAVKCACENCQTDGLLQHPGSFFLCSLQFFWLDLVLTILDVIADQEKNPCTTFEKLCIFLVTSKQQQWLLRLLNRFWCDCLELIFKIFYKKLMLLWLLSFRYNWQLLTKTQNKFSAFEVYIIWCFPFDTKHLFLLQKWKFDCLIKFRLSKSIINF